MNKIAIPTILAAMVLAAGLVVNPLAFAQIPAYLDIVEGELKVNDNVSMEIKLAGDATSGIPNAYGYAALTSDGQNVLAVTTHEGICDSATQTPGVCESVFHTHIVNLDTSSAVCASVASIEVTSASFSAPGKLEVDGKQVQVEDVPKASVGDLSGTIVSFNIVIVTVDGSTHICLDPKSSITVEIES